MKLASLEIKGFKSFADKTLIHFNENMTGIVGPNGCGKSNTIDAIRWVLGEQKSKSLRLEKMENVIFNGTKKRAASGRAEVALTFENTRNLLPTEFKNVTISRTLFRNGESEYRLNEVKCRLKDITNLFMDTGISSDSYAIIELKMIDEILNDKEESRRKLFEQAAGISKYKTRKKETLSKLEHTDGDLTRVEDLLAEIDKNLKTLERQAKRAEKYYVLKEEYKTLRIELAKHQLVDYKQKKTKIEAEQTTESDKKLAIETQITQLEADLESRKTQWIEQEQQLANAQKDFNQYQNNLRETENKKNLTAQNLSFARDKHTQLAQQIATAQHLLASLQKEVAMLENQQASAQNEVLVAQNGLGSLTQNVEEIKTRHRQMRAEVDKLQQQFKQSEYRIFEVEKKMGVKQSQREQAIREQKDYQNRIETQQRELNKLKQELDEVTMEVEEATETQQQLSGTDTELKQQIADLNTEVEQLRTENQQVHRLLDSKRNEFKLTKSLVDSLEGFPDSIKYLKNNTAQWNSNNAPLLLDLLNCDDAYKVAVENFLKNYLNFYVVPTADDAVKAIHLLDKNQKGKASFFILSDLENAETSLPLPTLSVGKAALSIMRIGDKKHQLLINKLLQNVYIIDNEEDIYADYLQKGYRFITTNGKVVRQNATLEGGSVGAYEGKRIGKRQYLVQLETEIKQLEEQNATLNTQTETKRKLLHEGQQTLRQNEQRINQQRNQTNALNQKLVSCKVKIDNVNNFISESANRQANTAERIDILNEEIGELNIESTDSRKAKDALNLQSKQAENDYRQISNELTQANQTYNDQNILFHQQQNKLNGIVQSLQFKKTQLTDTQQQYEQNTQTDRETVQKIDEAQYDLQTLETDVLQMYAQREEQQNQLNTLEAAYYKVRGDADVLEKDVRTQQRLRDQCNELLRQIEQERNRLDLQFLSVKERLYSECNVEIDTLLEQEPNTDDPKSLQDRLDKLRKQLDNYGEINHLAIEAYKELDERNQFIQAQRNDLLEAKKSLMKTMKEIEGTATELFMDAFNKVRDNFIHVFRSLFTDEDQCDLILVNPDDPLDSPIDIIAKPKGKRPQSINQLSGGEKSLTALALVFSLYLLKPAPFCILDEVDAPLDDANVNKFTKIIREFSKESQFIIVTHNKNTMASVDIIYGVTMYEEGVSRVVPVDFRSLTEEK